MPRIVELLLLDRPGDRPAKRLPLQDLERGDLIDTNHPDALFGQPLRIPVAPQDLLRSLLEPGIQAGRLPVPSAMRLQIDVVQQSADGRGTDRTNDAVRHGLPSQVLAGPMRNVQPLGNRFQAAQLNDLGSLHRRDLLRPSRPALTAIGQQPVQSLPPIALAGSPNGRDAAVQVGGDIPRALASSDSQHDLGAPHLVPGQAVTMSGCAQTVRVGRGKGQHARLTTTHECSPAGQGGIPKA